MIDWCLLIGNGRPDSPPSPVVVNVTPIDAVLYVPSFQAISEENCFLKARLEQANLEVQQLKSANAFQQSEINVSSTEVTFQLRLFHQSIQVFFYSYTIQTIFSFEELV